MSEHNKENNTAENQFGSQGPPPAYDDVSSTSNQNIGRDGRRPPYPLGVPEGFPQPPPYSLSPPVTKQPLRTIHSDEQAMMEHQFSYDIPSPVPSVTQPPTFGHGQPPASAEVILPPPLNCPPGLEYLTTVDQLLVHQKMELLEIVTGFETKNKFHVRNSLGQDIFYAVEDSDCLVRNCCGPIRPFDMRIFDNFRNEVIHLYRPLACDSCCFPCCLQSMEVFAPAGNLIGIVQQEWSIFFPTFAIKDSSGDTVLRLEGPFLTCSCCCNDVTFRITSADGSIDVGTITKQWSGCLKESFTDADNFGITFPMDMDVRMKAVLLGGCFLIDAMFFEQSGNNN